MTIGTRCHGEHLPLRPDWNCADCAAAWPCDQRRHALAAEFANDRLSMLLFLAACLGDAIDDFHRTGATPPDLHSRFLGWARGDGTAVQGKVAPHG